MPWNDSDSGGITGPAGGYDSWSPPGPGYPGGLWIVIDPPPGFQFPTSPPVAQPAPPPPAPSTGAPDEIPPITFPLPSGPAPSTPEYPREQLPSPEHHQQAPDGGGYPGGPPRYEWPDEPDQLAEEFLIWEAMRYEREGFDPEEFVWDWIGHNAPRELEDYMWEEIVMGPRTRQERARRSAEEWGREFSVPPIWAPSQVGTPPPELLQFVPRPVRPPPRTDQPFEWPNLPRWPFPRRERRVGPRRYPEIGPPGTPPLPDPNMIPLPLPEEMNPNPPPLPPRVIEFPEAPPLEAIPQPQIPAPQIEPWPVSPGAEPDTPPIPRAPPAPSPAPPSTAPAPQPGQIQVPQMTPWEQFIALPFFRRQRSDPRPSPLQEWIRARDVPPPAIGEQLPVAQPAIAQPIVPSVPQPTLPDLLPDLTPINATPLSFAQPGTRTDECRCEDEEKEERELRPSNVIAEVRSFRRRMSLNSLENLE
jgi:hypothetical protein